LLTNHKGIPHFTPLLLGEGLGGGAGWVLVGCCLLALFLQLYLIQLLIHQQALGCCVLNREWFKCLHADDEQEKALQKKKENF